MDKKCTARQEAQGRPCVVIEFGESGGFIVHADPGVHVFNRHEDPGAGGLCRYVNLPIPEEWLDEPVFDLIEEQAF